MWQLRWSAGAVAAIFKMADKNFQMSDISANNEDRNLMLVSISMFSWSEKPNMINIICQSLFLFSKWLSLLKNVAITSTHTCQLERSQMTKIFPIDDARACMRRRTRGIVN